MYAKDKEERLVEPINNSTVNKLKNIIVDKPIRFKNIAGEVDYRNLMNNKKAKMSESIVERFIELNKSKHRWLSEHDTSGDFHFNEMVRKEMLELSKRPKYIADVLVSFFYSNNSRYKDGLWDVYGELLYENLEKNLEGTIQCEECPERFKVKTDNVKYCEKCAKQKILESKRKWKTEKGRKS